MPQLLAWPSHAVLLQRATCIRCQLSQGPAESCRIAPERTGCKQQLQRELKAFEDFVPLVPSWVR